MTNTSILAAEYTTGKQPTLSFTEISNGRRTYLKTVPVSGKREARQMAAQFGYTPWNF